MDGGRRSYGPFVVAAVAVIALYGLDPAPRSAGDPQRPRAPSAAVGQSPSPSPSPSTADPMRSTATSSAMHPTPPAAPLSATDPTRPPSPPKDVVFTKDHHYYSSPWYDGAWQEMIGFGCTRAPYYPRDYSCPRSKPGKHHGIDTFMPCGTKVRSAVKGFVVPSPRLGGAYGKYGLKIRHGKYDFVLGHARRLNVKPGQHVKPGQLIARSGKRAAPDGCHLHFEKRPAGAGYTSAVDPLKSLRRTIVRFPHD